MHTFFHVNYAHAWGIPYKSRSPRQARVARCGMRTHDPWVYDNTASNWLATRHRGQDKNPTFMVHAMAIHWPNSYSTQFDRNEAVNLELGPSSDDYTSVFPCYMMTSSNGNIFRVTGHLCGEFTGPGEFPAQRPVTRSFDVFFDLRPKNGWVNNREAGDLRRLRAPLWRHFDGYARVQGIPYKPRPHRHVYVARCGRRTHFFCH